MSEDSLIVIQKSAAVNAGPTKHESVSCLPVFPYYTATRMYGNKFIRRIATFAVLAENLLFTERV